MLKATIDLQPCLTIQIVTTSSSIHQFGYATHSQTSVNTMTRNEFFILAQQCKNEGEIFMECGLSCARTCRDLRSADIKCKEECVPECQCPNGQYLNDQNRCVPASQCPCEYQGKTIQPGESVTVGDCKTW